MTETRDPDQLTSLAKFQPMPDLHPDKYESLKEGIREEGVRDPVHIDEDGNILDGHHRVQACKELGELVPVTEHRGLSEDEKITFAWEQNMQQRQLEEAEQQDLIEDRLKQLDSRGIPKTNEAVANELGVSESWVGKVRRQLADAGEIGTGPDLSTLPQQQKRDGIRQYVESHPNESNRGVGRALGVSKDTVGSVRQEGDREEVAWDEDMRGEHVFPYIGSKYNIASWLVSKFPKHGTYVEPFAGSAAVLFTKPREGTEVYNDADEDLVHFFRTLQEDPEGIEDVLADVDLKYEQHQRWTRHWYEGWRPSLEEDDSGIPGPDARRAAVFFFTRYSQYKNRVWTHAGFDFRANPTEFEAQKTRLTEVAKRFRDVRIENRDYMEVLEEYDRHDTLFYLDPPYVEKEGYYGEFTHEWLVEVVNELEGKFILSYGEKLPDGLDHHRRVELTDIPGDRADVEHHIMNFDMSEEGGYRDARASDW